MTSTQTGLLFVQGLFSAAVALYILFEWFRGRREQQKYRLYAVRDTLLNLVATKKISERDPLFKVFYAVLNKSISEVKDVTFVSFVKATLHAKMELERRQRALEFARSIETASPEVRDFVATFASTMMEIMRDNSLMLIIMLRVGMNSQQLVRKLIGPSMFPRQRSEIQTYRYFKTLYDSKSVRRQTADSFHNCPAGV